MMMTYSTCDDVSTPWVKKHATNFWSSMQAFGQFSKFF